MEIGGGLRARTREKRRSALGFARGDAKGGRRGRSKRRPYEETATAAGSIARNCCAWDAVRRFHDKIKDGAATMAAEPRGGIWV